MFCVFVGSKVLTWSGILMSARGEDLEPLSCIYVKLVCARIKVSLF